MAILSHGVDLVDVQRIEHMLESHGERFTDRVFTAGERSYADAGGQQRAERYAARFACKEAVFKVLGTGWGQGVSWSEVDVSRNADGKPGIEVTGIAAQKAELLGIREWFVSISHTAGQAMASVIAAGEPAA